jgi:hypothetical protein
MHKADRDGLWGRDRLGGPLRPPPHELAQEGSDRGAVSSSTSSTPIRCTMSGHICWLMGAGQ